MITAAPVPVSRRHDIDALRVFAFGLLILYHVGMFYVDDWGWHVKSTHLSDALKWPMMLVNQWRMPLLFLISGLVTRLMLCRATPAAVARARTMRLLVPLLFGMAVVVPPQAWVQALSNGAFDGGYAAFLVRYFSFSGWPEGAFDGSHVGITWNHLWFLPYVLLYALLVVALQPVLCSHAGRALQDRFARLRGWRLWLVPAVPLTVASWALAGPFPTTHDLINDWSNHAQSFTMFLFGYWIGLDRALWAELRARRHAFAVAALVTFSAWIVLLLATTPGVSLERAFYDFVQRLNTWTWLLAVLAWGHHYLDRPFPWLPYATEAVYPWYVLHQTITVVAGYGLSRYALGPVAEPVVLILATAGACLLVHELLIRRSALLRPLFGLGPRRTAKTARGPLGGMRASP